jgi:hypothetical protein
MTWHWLVAAGVSPSRIRAQLDAGRWRRWGHAIVLHNGPLTQVESWYVARVHGGQGALLTAFTAAQAYGLPGWERDDIHVLARAHVNASQRSPVPLALHRVRNWSEVRRHPTCRVHVLHQALCVAAATFSSARPACGLFAAAVQQRLTTPARLVSTVEARPRQRHRTVLLAALHDIGQGAEALSEIDFVRLCRAHGLPPPRQQRVRRTPDGKRRYLDAEWIRADGRVVVVEVDGAFHTGVDRWWDDQLRQNTISLGDALVLRFPSVIVRTEPELVVAQLRQALGLV